MTNVTYVLDTSTMIYDPQVFFKYENADFIIPDRSLRELDNIKTSHDHKGRQAREVFRILSGLRSSAGCDFSKGVDHGNGGNIYVVLNHIDSTFFKKTDSIPIENNDDIILNVTRNVCLERVMDKNPDIQWDKNTGCVSIHNADMVGNTQKSLKKFVIDKMNEEEIYLMTQDAAMSIRADMVNIKTKRHFVDSDDFVLGTGVTYINISKNYYMYGEDNEDIRSPLEDLYKNKFILAEDYSGSGIPQDLPVNTGVVLKSGSNSVLGVSDGDGGIHLICDKELRLKMLQPKGVEQTIASHLMSGDVRNNYSTHHKNSNGHEFICSLSGKAGSGKTTVALLNALHGVMNNKYDRIIVFRPTVNMSENSNLGFLPGSLDEKMEPWTEAIKDVFRSVGMNYGDDSTKGAVHTSIDLDSVLSVEPVNYLRGRTFNNTFVIVDEAQNLEPHELLTIVTRLGYGSSLVMTWDAAQVDNAFLQSKKAEAPLSVLRRVMPNDRVFHIELPNNERGGMSALFT